MIHWRIPSPSDASRTLARWRAPQSVLDFDVVQRANVNHQAADTLQKLRTDGKGTTPSDKNLPVCIVKIIQVTKDKILYVHVCMVWDARNDLMTNKPDKDPTRKEELRLSAVQPTIRKRSKGEVPKIQESIVEQTNEAYCCEATTQEEISGSGFHVDHNGFLVQTSTMNGCLQKVKPVLLR